MRARIERIREESLDTVPAESAWRQRDVVNDDQVDRRVLGTWIEIGRDYAPRAEEPAIIVERLARRHCYLMPRRSIRYRIARNVMPSSFAAAVRL